jgi:hypothetical protein
MLMPSFRPQEIEVQRDCHVALGLKSFLANSAFAKEARRMAEQDRETIPGIVRSLLEDTRELIREEIALARSEIREEMTAVQTVGVAFGAAAVAGLIGLTILCVAIGGAVADVLNWPPWSGNAIVAVLLLTGAFLAVRYGRARLGAIRALPNTTATLKENIAWIQNKSGDK